jgi:hypothetical protein
MKDAKSLGLFVGLVASVACGSAEPLLVEAFAYPAGRLLEAAPVDWKAAQGSLAAEVSDGVARLSPSASGEAFAYRRFAAIPPAGSTVFARLVVRFDPPEDGASGFEGVFLQFVDPSGRTRRGRLAVRSLPDGSFRLGVTSKNHSGIVWAQSEFAPAEDHEVTLAYDSASGASRLWTVPFGPEVAPQVEARDEDVMTPGGISLQVGNRFRSGVLQVRDLVVTAGIQPTAVAVPVPVAQASEWKLAAVPPSKENFHIFVLAGQSNMAGRGIVEPQDQATDPRILVWRGDTGWALAREPLHDDKPRAAGVGPGLAFARAVLSTLPDGAVIGLIPVAFGGSSIVAWDKSYSGDQRWPNGETYYQRMIAAARTAAADGTLAGVLWNQGESDAGRAASDGGASYLRTLVKLIGDLRADLKVPELPFIASTLGPWRQNSEAFNTAILSLPERVAACAVIDTGLGGDGPALVNKPNDPSHYDSNSARRLGAMYAEALAHLTARQ